MSRTVLIVENQWNHRKRAVLALEISGYTVIEVENGEQALDCLSKRKIDLILTDWSMPVMSGHEMLEKIKQNASWDLPIIVLSSQEYPYTTALDMESLGILSWIQKPFRISTLRNTVSEHLDMKYPPGSELNVKLTEKPTYNHRRERQ